MSLILTSVLFLLLLLLQGTLLQLSCSLCEAPRPGYARALGVALLGGLLAAVVGGGWSCTFGLIVRLLIGSAVAGALQVCLVWMVTSAVYRSALGLPFGHAAIVAAVHNLMAWAIGAALWALHGWVG